MAPALHYRKLITHSQQGPSMATIHFFGKPDCINNRKQKELLKAAGHTLLVYDILNFNFTAPALRTFFEDKPVAEWFNPTAPAIKSGAIDPSIMTEDNALPAMLVDRLLIKRPLIQAGTERFCGFVIERIASTVGLTAPRGMEAAVDRLLHDDLVTCPKLDNFCRSRQEAGHE
jgi:nitrogenase-associated protein